jgi:hypothetical protein
MLKQIDLPTNRQTKLGSGFSYVYEYNLLEQKML